VFHPRDKKELFERLRKLEEGMGGEPSQTSASPFISPDVEARLTSLEEEVAKLKLQILELQMQKAPPKSPRRKKNADGV
jgi:hypothetical protein